MVAIDEFKPLTMPESSRKRHRHTQLNIFCALGSGSPELAVESVAPPSVLGTAHVLCSTGRLLYRSRVIVGRKGTDDN